VFVFDVVLERRRIKMSLFPVREQKVLKVIPSSRGARFLNGSYFLICEEPNQTKRWRKATSYIYQKTGKKMKTIRQFNSNGSARCYNCGKLIEPYEVFYWRLYGLCSHCFDLSTDVSVQDNVLVLEVDGVEKCVWELPGGKIEKDELDERRNFK